MSYENIIDDLADRVERLQPRWRAAVFWLVGTGLRSGLDESERAGWVDWLEDASRLSVEFIVDGRVGDGAEAVWDEAGRPTGEASQLLNSVVICSSSPLAIALDPDTSAGSWIEHALFPVIHKVSLDMFEYVAFPDDDNLEDVIADPRVQAALSYCISTCERLETEPQVHRQVLEQLLEGASVLLG